MPDLFDLFIKWWKQIVAVVLLSLLVAGLIVFMKPQQYLAVTTAAPASSLAADRSKIFNENIEALYSNLGNPDDLDMMVGTAQLDTIYLAVTDQFNLFDHYKMQVQDDAARIKAAKCLKKNSKVMKSEYGELKVKVWDTDKNLAPQLANALMDKLGIIHSNLQNAGNETILKGLIAAREKMRTGKDSTNQLQQYDKLINQYELMVNIKTPSLVIVEKAKSSLRPDKPRRIEVMVITFVLSLLFALLAALVMERRKSTTA